jgi:hypothetical protein
MLSTLFAEAAEVALLGVGFITLSNDVGTEDIVVDISNS